MANKVEFPKKDGVAPVSKPKNIFLNKPKYCTIANKLAKNPAIKFTFINLFQYSPLMKTANKIAKIKKKVKFKVPPDLAGDPNTLNIISSEVIVDMIETIKTHLYH